MMNTDAAIDIHEFRKWLAGGQAPDSFVARLSPLDPVTCYLRETTGQPWIVHETLLVLPYLHPIPAPRWTAVYLVRLYALYSFSPIPRIYALQILDQLISELETEEGKS